MITRIVGDLIDVWLLAGRFGRRVAPRLADAWRTWPGDAMAWLVMAACGGLRVTREVRLPDGDRALLVEDPRAALYLDHVPLKPYAQTLGRIVLSRTPLSDETVRHELEHVRQWRRLGPLFLLVYGLEFDARDARRRRSLPRQPVRIGRPGPGTGRVDPRVLGAARRSRW